MNVKLVLKVLLGLVILLGVVAAGTLGWASSTSAALLSAEAEAHAASFPIPFPLTAEEIEAGGLTDEEAEAIALERAVERGGHLVKARYGCMDCHGENLAGGTMIDAAPMGVILGPNLTSGEGSVVVGYTAADWDRIVRHGVKRSGTRAIMPAQDFHRMSDQELSDIVAFIRAAPPMAAEVPAPTLGPLGKFLVATGALPASYDLISDHAAPHSSEPPAAAVTVEFGQHLTAVCTGCHGAELSGGVVPGGDPSWPPAANLTPHEDGLGSWGFGDFVTALREGVRPDGVPLRTPMAELTPAANAMTDVELEAIWTYLQSIDAKPDGS